MPAVGDEPERVEPILDESDSDADRMRIASLGEADLSDNLPDPEESPQQTSASAADAALSVQLTGIEAGGATRLTDQKLEQIALEFPFEVAISAEQTGTTEGGILRVRDSRQGRAIATVHSSSDGTQLNWDAGAKRSFAAPLAHGRFTSTEGTSIYLRPQIQAEPWRFKFDRQDVRPTWDLGHPIPPRASRIAVEFELPEDTRCQWIEQIEPDSLRRARGTAVLTSSAAPDVSIGVRFNIRCSRKLSCRMRFAAKLDPSMAWQTVSSPLLANLAALLTQQATLLSRESERLARLQKQTKGAARRFLQLKRDRVQQQSDLVRTTSERTAQLQTLIAKIESEAALRVRVWVDWPDTEQTLLSVGQL